MTDKQKEAIKIVLEQCYDRHLSVEEALVIMEAIGEPIIQYVPQPTYPLTPYYDSNSNSTIEQPDKVTSKLY